MAVAAVLAVAMASLGCTPPPQEPAPPGPPTVSAFHLVAQRGAAPIVGALRWGVGDPNGDPLTCSVDLDDDGVADRVITGCSSASSVLVQLDDPGTHTFGIEVSDGEFPAVAATLEVTVDPAPPESFEITLRLDPAMDPVFADAFQDAADRWGEVITAGVPDVAADIPAGLVGWNPAFQGTVDDLLIDARAVAMDGPGNLLGRAGGLLVRSGHWQPYWGIMEFDSADLAQLAAAGRLESVILHEMGHVLGVGTSWFLTGRIVDLLFDPAYNGPAGVAAYRQLGGSGYVPVEDEGDLGTALGHWRESVFHDELMTGYLGWGGAPLSILTVAALADQGYGVDLSAADAYDLTPPAARSAQPATPPLHLEVEHLPPITGT